MPQIPSSNIAFTPTIKAIQQRKGSRHGYAQMEARGGWQTTITSELATFIDTVRSFYLATANAEGQPYIQHRGGPPGFLQVLGESTLAIVDFKGNRQFITQGNLEENAKAFIFLMDYESRRRIKIWGTARMVEDDTALIGRLMPEGYTARPEQVLLFEIEAWDANCPQHIPQRFEAEDVARALAARDARIAELEARLAEATKKG
ncbi:MAG: pyridoxamine 5'-phosphate oxidase [Rhizobiales bacterium PAR1]|nr:MAG: pyridoxamine 5'-phosphate oxidase [Rhizobiales bacterium PAR1]